MNSAEMPISTFNSAANGMSRPSKIFIKVDKEGLLTDTIAISDVVNFDCYESIVSSAQRIIASFNGTQSENIVVETVYYYKKRARSSRMNPVILCNTTDGFRAVAEHPHGEVPIGILWSKKATTVASIAMGKKPALKKAIKMEQYVISGNSLQKSASPSPTPDKNSSDSEIPEKRRKTESPVYKTYMPTYESDVAPFDTPPMSQSPDFISKGGNHRQTPSPVVPPKPPPIQNMMPSRNQTKMFVTYLHKEGNRDPDEGKYYVDQTKHPCKSQFQWPSDTSCEVVMNYNGISERKVLSQGVSFVVQSLINGNYSVLNRELQSSFEATKGASDKTAQEMINVVNQPVPQQINNIGQTEKVPIKYLQDAKTEIFKVLSLLSLSKARFQQLLDWMKSFRLEEGKQGKFYLSERNIIGGGLRVTYDTDEQAAMRLSHIYKTRSRSNPVNVLHPIQDQNTRAPNAFTTTVPMTEQPHNQIMFLMPQSSLPVTSTINDHISAGAQQLKPVNASQYGPVVLSAGKSLLPPAETKKGKRSKQQKSSQGLVDAVSVSHAPSESPKLEQVQYTDVVTTQASPTIPSILRRKQRNPTQKIRPSTNPVPMHLYRSYPTDSDPGNMILSNLADSSEQEGPLAHIKQEPDEYGDSSDATEDYDQNSEKGPSPAPPFFSNASKNYSDVLKSDVQMPQTTEHNEKPFQLVIKSEPIDDGYQ